MPCDNNNHTHVWSTEGELSIERCEKFCGFCGKWFKHAWFVRRHVKNVHKKEYPKLMLKGGWKSSPEGNRKPNSPEKSGSRSRTSSSTRTSSFSGESVEKFTPPQFLENFAVAEMMQNDHTFVMDPNDMANLFALPFGADYTAVSSFVTPQNVRTNGQAIEGVMPTMAHHGAAGLLAEGLNNVIRNVTANGAMTEQEVVYVLETFTDTFKVGIAMPLSF